MWNFSSLHRYSSQTITDLKVRESLNTECKEKREVLKSQIEEMVSSTPSTMMVLAKENAEMISNILTELRMYGNRF